MQTSRRSCGLTTNAKPAIVPCASSNGLRIGVLIVAYNAARTLAGVLLRIPADVRRNIEEIAVFDDASSDATYELAIGLQALAQDYELKVIKNERNLGYGGNQKAGYRYFEERGFDIVVLLHGDGQYAPEVLHHLYAPIVAGKADAVFGSRMMPDYGGALRGGMPLYKLLGNKILSAFENHALGLSLTEFHSGYRAYNLRAIEKIDMSRMTGDFHFDTEIIIKLAHQGFRMVEVPIPTYYGTEICYVSGMKYAWNVVRAVSRYRSTIGSISRSPEFDEYFIDDPVKANARFKERARSSHRIIQGLVGSRQVILDIGCGDGSFAAQLNAEHNCVSGIDIIPAPRHREAFTTYVCADLNAGLASAAKQLVESQFDKVLLMDVLQQLHNPALVLRESAALLKPTGLALLSLPNVANVSLRLNLPFGRVAYSDSGIIDRRHLSFLTRKAALALVEACGYDVVAEKVTTIPLEFAFGVAPNNPLIKIFDAALALLCLLLPRLFAYQWIFVVRPRRA